MSVSSARFAFAILFLAVTCWTQLLAHSISPPPIKRFEHPSTLALEILPRQRHSTHARRSFPLDSPILHHTDSFRLTLFAFDETFYLHLRPNEHLIHPAARIHHYSSTPSGGSILTHTEPLLRESVRAYWGEVIPAYLSATRMREDAVGLRYRPPGQELGWARIMVHDQGDVDRAMPPVFEGAFSVNGVVHHVMTKENYLRTKQPMDPHVEAVSLLDYPDSALVIWRDSDALRPHELSSLGTGLAPQKPQTCGLERFPQNTDPSVNPLLRKRLDPSTTWYNPLGLLDISFPGLVKRDDVAGGGMGVNFVNSINNSNGCPKTPKILYMGVAADCVYTSIYGSKTNASTQIINNWNKASGLYKTTFNVSLGIVELQVFDPTCPSTADPNIAWNVDCSQVQLNDRLSLFSDWRGKKGTDGAGLWHLMSGCPTGSEVGIAWLGTLCEQTSSGNTPSVVSGTAVSTAGRTEWQVVAHETGHNFGAIHDCASPCNSTSPCCPLSSDTCDSTGKFLMSPTAEIGESMFSPCSLGNVCAMMVGVQGGQTNTSCLSDPDPKRHTISLQMCGNGIVEDGEDCDPGVGVKSPCCNSSTCKFNSGAVCDPESSPCCTNSCTFAPATQVCRPSKDPQCDKPESCTGNSSACPADQFSPNGQSCGSNGLACASGQCTSLAQQCQNAGGAMNLSKPCPQFNDQSCRIACQDPRQALQCVLLQTPLIDGSPCGLGGICSKGVCQAGNLLSTAKAWFTSNLQVSIPVTVAAVLIFIIIVSLIYKYARICCCPRSRKPVPPPNVGPRRHVRLGSWDATQGPPPLYNPHAAPPPSLRPGRNTSSSPPFPPPSSVGFQRGPRDNWVDHTLYNGPSR